jgi:ribonuclease HII
VSREELEQLLADRRAGVRKLAEARLREWERTEKERERIEAMWRFEREHWATGVRLIAGVDEAGRGPLAGPVVAAAVILPPDFDATGLNDSKQLTEAERNELRKRIEERAVAIGVGIVEAEEIDRLNILQATYQAMRIALSQLSPAAEMVLADAVQIPGITVPQLSLIKGDARSHSIAAASVIAKTERDAWMKRAAERYPEYGFERHMGYATPEHLEALRKWGPSPIHRRTFAPVRDMEQPDLFSFFEKDR